MIEQGELDPKATTDGSAGIRVGGDRGHKFWPFGMTFARLGLGALIGALIAGGLAVAGDPTPLRTAAPWWIVFGTLIDLGCLALLSRLTRYEGIRVVDLLGLERQRLGRDLLLGVGLIVPAFILFMAGGMVFGPLIYGGQQAPAAMSPLPLWATVFAALVWPAVWALTEDLTYLGYALPRLEARFGRAWPAVAIVTVGWAIQHCVLPILPGWQWVLYRFASALPIALGLTLIYRRTRRLVPFIVAHWALDLAAVLMLVVFQLPAM